MSTLERNEISSQFSQWVQHDIIETPTVSRKENIAKYTGYFLGVTGAVIFFNLGYSMSNIMFDQKEVNIVTSIIAASPIAILGSMFTSHILQNIVKSPSVFFQNISERPECKNQIGHYSLNTFTASISAISAAPLVYLVYSFYRDYKWAMYSLFVCTFFSKAISDYWAISTMGKLLFEVVDQHTHCLTPNTYKKTISQKIDSSVKTMRKINNDHAKIIFKNVQESITQQKLDFTHFFNIRSNRYTETDTLLDKEEAQPITRTVLGAIGGIIGVISGACLVPLGESAMQGALSTFQIHNDKATHALGWVVGLLACSLMSYTAKDSFEKNYDFFYRLYSHGCHASHTKEFLLLTVSAILGAFSSAPQAYLSYTYIGNESFIEKIVLSCAIIGPFFMSFWAIDSFLSHIFIQDEHKERNNLIKILLSIKKNVDKFNKKSLTFLENEFENQTINQNGVNDIA